MVHNWGRALPAEARQSGGLSETDCVLPALQLKGHRSQDFSGKFLDASCLDLSAGPSTFLHEFHVGEL